MVPEEVAWHDARQSGIRSVHPEVRRLFGHDPRTQFACLGTVGAHFAVASALGGASLLPWLGATVTIGPTLAHAIGVLIHEASHNLIARSTTANKAWSIFLNLPLGAPAAIDFRAQHLLHHRHLGEGDTEGSRDTQSPTLEEDRWVGTSMGRKVLSFTWGRFYWKGRPANAVSFDRFRVINWTTSLGAMAVVSSSWGVGPALYLLCSSLLAFGPHTFGAWRLSEHLPVVPGQPTNSYYGPLNWFSFNVGYHVEHHDFPNVPWTRIKEAPESRPRGVLGALRLSLLDSPDRRLLLGRTVSRPALRGGRRAARRGHNAVWEALRNDGGLSGLRRAVGRSSAGERFFGAESEREDSSHAA